MDNEKSEEIRRKQQEIINLKCELTSQESEIGDYKIVKTYEARLRGKTDPYDTNALLAERQKIRDKINELQSELENL